MSESRAERWERKVREAEQRGPAPCGCVPMNHKWAREHGYVRLDGVDVEALRKGLACVRWSPGGGYATHVPEILVEVAETILALAEGDTTK